MGSGVKVVGAEDQAETVVVEPPMSVETVEGNDRLEVGGAGHRVDGFAPRESPRGRRSPVGRRRRIAVVALAVLAALGLAGTLGFGLAWAGQQAQQAGEAQARATASRLIVDLTNFDAKTVDADFSAITAMGTGDFASQADRFFNSSIRQQLEDALASSRGQVRSLYVQTYGGGQASVYAVVDQLYANNKISAPQSDVLRLVVDVSQVGSGWKVADVTVLTGPSSASGVPGTTSGTAAPSGGATSTTPTTAAGG
jgi:hypothetical protein